VGNTLELFEPGRHSE